MATKPAERPVVTPPNGCSRGWQRFGSRHDTTAPRARPLFADRRRGMRRACRQRRAVRARSPAPEASLAVGTAVEPGRVLSGDSWVDAPVDFGSQLRPAHRLSQTTQSGNTDRLLRAELVIERLCGDDPESPAGRIAHVTVRRWYRLVKAEHVYLSQPLWRNELHPLIGIRVPSPPARGYIKARLLGLLRGGD